jgi:hypothetical protein
MSKTLIALAAIAAGAIATDSPALDVGARFEAPDDVAEQLIVAGNAKPDDAEPKSKVRRTKVRLLVDSVYGNANDVVELDAAQLKDAKASGLADDDKSAVAYAAGLPQNNPKA